MSASDGKLPLILLTGFLGAGKTTVLNRVLGAQHRRRVGVIINELGRIDIDTRLIKSRAGDVMELAGGCVCHEVRVQSELWAAIDEVARRARPEVVLIETTGIAEPWSILDGLEALGFRGLVLFRPTGDLAGHVVARPSEVGKADGLVVGVVQVGEGAQRRHVDGVTLGGLIVGQ